MFSVLRSTPVVSHINPLYIFHQPTEIDKKVQIKNSLTRYTKTKRL